VACAPLSSSGGSGAVSPGPAGGDAGDVDSGSNDGGADVDGQAPIDATLDADESGSDATVE
jgi:hypothetical protein